MRDKWYHILTQLSQHRKVIMYQNEQFHQSYLNFSPPYGWLPFTLLASCYCYTSLHTHSHKEFISKWLLSVWVATYYSVGHWARSSVAVEKKRLQLFEFTGFSWSFLLRCLKPQPLAASSLSQQHINSNGVGMKCSAVHIRYCANVLGTLNV